MGRSARRWWFVCGGLDILVSFAISQESGCLMYNDTIMSRNCFFSPPIRVHANAAGDVCGPALRLGSCDQ